MCGRYVFNKPGAILDEVLESLDGYELASDQPDLEPRFNIAPTQEMPIIHRPNPGAGTIDESSAPPITISVARWSFLGSGQRHQRSGRPLINARLETVKEKPSFAASFQSRRCLVPASGFYEWRAHGNRQPFLFQATEPTTAGFCFAGLWQSASPSMPNDNQQTSRARETREYCIITGAAGPSMAEVHHRRPVILAPRHYTKWLDPNAPSEELLNLLRHDDPPLDHHPVSFRVNKVHCDDPSLLDPVREAPTNLSLF